MSKAFSIPLALTSPEARQVLTWETFREGIEISWIYKTGAPDGPSAAFLRYAPGSSVPRHAHRGHEHILVLEGSQTDENGRHDAGTVVINPPGTAHSVVSEDGCVVLAVWEKPVSFL
jgi:anti-sigma factor ChrR (cupin superfamily)